MKTTIKIMMKKNLNVNSNVKERKISYKTTKKRFRKKKVILIF